MYTYLQIHWEGGGRTVVIGAVSSAMTASKNKLPCNVPFFL